MILRKVLATFVFEFSRSLTTSRISTSLILAFFAPVMLWLIGASNNALNFENQIPFPLLLIGIFQLLAMFLAVLLWATPVVYSELEGKTWTYLAIRPHGKLASTLGKLLNAVFWATATTVISLTLCCLVISLSPTWDPAMVNVGKETPEGKVLLHASHPTVIWYSLAPGLFLGALTLSAIFVHIGLITHKRGMIFAVTYGIVESIFAFLPAVIRQFTVGFHLRNIGLKTANFNFREFDPGVITNDSQIWVHVMALLIITAIHLGASIYWLHSREYITAEEA